ncbi:MAG: sensor histidine kinase, partial [Burkholderiales bacterium]
SGRVSDVLMDEKRMPHVFQNLLENAIQHSSAGGEVRVQVTRPEDSYERWVVCTITDSGPGFSEQDVTRVFDPFFTRRKGGTGLGLSIAQRIVENHGGKISAANSGQGGAVMTVWLPVADSPAATTVKRQAIL